MEDSERRPEDEGARRGFEAEEQAVCWASPDTPCPSWLRRRRETGRARRGPRLPGPSLGPAGLQLRFRRHPRRACAHPSPGSARGPAGVSAGDLQTLRGIGGRTRQAGGCVRPRRPLQPGDPRPREPRGPRPQEKPLEALTGESQRDSL